MAQDKLNVFQRINAVREKIDYIKKDKQVQTYKAVTHDQVTALVRDHLVKFGVVVYPNLVSSVTMDTGEKTSKGTPIIRVEAVYDFVFVNIDDPADKFTASVSAHANDQGDKAPGKALSYAKKAVILKVFEIETGEDDESRYAGFDVDDWITSIQSAQTIAELQQSYNDAVGAALKAKDMAAKQMIIVAKDKRKAELA
jgi:hypothetical protein